MHLVTLVHREANQSAVPAGRSALPAEVSWPANPSGWAIPTVVRRSAGKSASQGVTVPLQTGSRAGGDRAECPQQLPRFGGDFFARPGKEPIMQPTFAAFAVNTRSLRAGQSALDNAMPVDRPEPPCMKREIADLMTGTDTDLVTYTAFADEVDQEVLQDVPPGWLTELLINCLQSDDPSVKCMAETQRTKMEDIAGRMLDKKWSEDHGRH